MNPEQLPVLKPEVGMARPIETQPASDEVSAKLYSDVKNGVVKIATDKERPGSGFIVDDGSQIITTARNVVGSKEQFAFGPDGKRYKLELEKLDDLADVAVLRIKNGAIAGTKPLTLGTIEKVDAGDRLWGVSIPHTSNFVTPYLSPGYARGLSTPLEMITTMEPVITMQLNDKLKTLDKATGKDAALYLMQPAVDTRMHVELGSGGGPIFDKDHKVVGITMMSNGMDLRSGQTLAVPVDNARDLMDNGGEFTFKYKAKAENWAEDFMSDWRNDKGKAIVDTGLTGLLAGVGLKAAARFPIAAGAGIGGYGLMKLSSDAGNLLQSTDSADVCKYGLASVADLGTVGGAAMMLAPKLRGYGLALAGIGIAGRMATDFIRNRWAMDETKRKDDGSNRPPFSLDELLKQ